MAKQYCYLCEFQFTVVNPESSEFSGKSGDVEILTDEPLSQEEMDSMKTDKNFKEHLIQQVLVSHKIKNVFSLEVTSVTFKGMK